MTVVCLPNCVFLSETSRQIAIYKALVASGTEAVLATHGGPYGPAACRVTANPSRLPSR